MKQIVDRYSGKFNETETSNKQGVLATIHGPITGWKSNRNGRTYSKELWEKALNSEYVKEQVALRHFVGEADHPEDRLEPIIKEMSHSITDFEFRNDLQEVWATIDILDTPNGHMLKTLLDYSGALSFSTRGSGDVLENGEVDPDTYQLFAVDAVLRPSYPTATVRLSESENLVKLTDNQAKKLIEKYSGNKLVENWSEVDHKSVIDSDGFYTDYTLYKNNENKFRTVFGDRDIYRPEDTYDMDFDSEKEALEFFNSYKGFEEDDYFESAMFDLNKNTHPKKIKESRSLKNINKHMLNENGNPSLKDRIEATLTVWFEDNTEDMLDRTITCDVNSEGYSYVITVKSSVLSRYNFFDEYDVMEYADDAGNYIADALKIEYIGSEKVNDRTFKIYLDNYYTK